MKCTGATINLEIIYVIIMKSERIDDHSEKEEDGTIRFKDIIIVFCLACNNIILATNHTAPTFHNYTPDFKCKGYPDRDPCNLKVYSNESQLSLSITPVSSDICQMYEYHGENGEISVVTEWNLVCNMKIYSALSVTLYFVAVAIGALIAGVLTDKYGRRSVLYACIYAQGIIGIFISLTAYSYIPYVILRSAQGLFIQGILSSTYLLINEILPGKHRTIITGIIEIFWGLGLILLAVIAYLLPNWRHLNLTTCLIPLVIASFSLWFVPESKTWLKMRAAAKEMKNNKRKKQNNDDEDVTKYRKHGMMTVCKIDNHISTRNYRSAVVEKSVTPTSDNRSLLKQTDESKINRTAATVIVDNVKLAATTDLGRQNDNKSLSGNEVDNDVVIDWPEESTVRSSCDQIFNSLTDIKSSQNDNNNNDNNNRSMWFQIKIVFSTAILRNRLLLMMLLWFTESVSYYGITFSIPELFGDHYVNFIISGFIEIMCFVIICSIICRSGRKPTMIAAYFTSGFCYLLAAFLSNDYKWTGILRTCLVIFGKGCVMGNYMCLLLYTMELFPTNLRGMSLGVSLFCSQTGTFIAPIILLLEALSTRFTLSFLMFATLNISASVFVYCLLPETKNSTLPETIEEAVELNK